MERVGDRYGKMERYCSTGQSPQWAVAPKEEEEEVSVAYKIWLLAQALISARPIGKAELISTFPAPCQVGWVASCLGFFKNLTNDSAQNVRLLLESISGHTAPNLKKIIS